MASVEHHRKSHGCKLLNALMFFQCIMMTRTSLLSSDVLINRGNPVLSGS